MRESVRMQPQLPADAMKTYSVSAPRATHFRRASCSEVECANQASGWKTAIDESTDLGKQQAFYIRNRQSRHFTEDRNQQPGLTVFTFEAGQECFAGHEVRIDKPEIYLVKGGDWRGNPRGLQTVKHASAADWVDDFANHQDQLSSRLNQG